jgi:hypothetical protein
LHGFGQHTGLQHGFGGHGLGHGLQQGSRSQQQQPANIAPVAAKANIELIKPLNLFFIETLLCLGLFRISSFFYPSLLQSAGTIDIESGCTAD